MAGYAPGFKVLVKSPFSQYSGYGADGFGMLRALRNWGCDVYPQPQWVDVPIPADLIGLFTKTLEGPFDLTINHWSPGELGLRPEAREMTRCAVAWTMWEFAGHTDPETGKYTSGLIPHCNKRGTLRKRLELFDLILGYDSVTTEVLGPYVPKRRGKKGDGVPVGVLQGGYESGDWRKNGNRDWFTETDFMFGMHGALGPRKNAWLVVQAFNELKHEHPEEFAGAKLGLHSLAPGLFPELNDIMRDKRVRVFLEPWTHDHLQAFYDACHVLLAPSRGEGKNLPALEAMTTGCVVAATNFGGHTAWLGEAYAYPLGYTLEPTFPGRPDAAHDARVSLDELKSVMWHIYTHRAEAREKAELASTIIPQMCDWAVVVENLFRRIRDLVPYNGALIYDMAMRAKALRDQEVMAQRGERSWPRDDAAGDEHSTEDRRPLLEHAGQ